MNPTPFKTFGQKLNTVGKWILTAWIVVVSLIPMLLGAILGYKIELTVKRREENDPTILTIH